MTLYFARVCMTPIERIIKFGHVSLGGDRIILRISTTGGNASKFVRDARAVPVIIFRYSIIRMSAESGDAVSGRGANSCHSRIAHLGCGVARADLAPLVSREPAPQLCPPSHLFRRGLPIADFCRLNVIALDFHRYESDTAQPASFVNSRASHVSLCPPRQNLVGIVGCDWLNSDSNACCR
jgi:hypothetical protein